MTDVPILKHVTDILEQRDRAVALLAERIKDTYVSFQQLETRMERLRDAIDVRTKELHDVSRDIRVDVAKLQRSEAVTEGKGVMLGLVAVAILAVCSLVVSVIHLWKP